MKDIKKLKEKLRIKKERKKYIDSLKREATRKYKTLSVVSAIEFRREQYDLSCAEMADVLGVSKGKYSDFIHGNVSLSIKALRRAYNIGVPAECCLGVARYE